MDFDFELLLVVAVVASGVIWLVDLLWLRAARGAAAGAEAQQIARQVEGAAAAAPEGAREPVVVEYARAFFPVLLAVLVLRSFVVEPFRIPSGSMMPTLLTGDFILVNKFSYGIRLPVFHTKVVDTGEPARGDVAVFRFPEDPSVDYIKRVVGLPGDTVVYRGKQLFINGEPVPQKDLGPYVGSGESAYMTGARLRLEKLGEVEHKILIAHNRPLGNGTFIVPEGHYFVMGDNRDNSNDSRFWGFVPEENLVGRAFMIWMNWDSVDKRVGWERIGDMIE